MQSRGEYASFGSRFLAAFIDEIILIILSFIAGGSFAIRGVSDNTVSSLKVLLIDILISWLYYASQESSRKQATIGKQVMNIVVTDLNGNRISFGRASRRYFSKILSALILYIGYMMAAFTEKKQALHDMIAGTLVVSTKR